MGRRANSIRIIGGVWRSRRVDFPAALELRPTPDRVRETLFNWLGQNLSGKSCLDLFAGSGALGFEAASRGASEVTMVEKDRTVFTALQANARRLGARNVRLVRADALEFLRVVRPCFDVVFLDPPFSLPLPQQLLARMPGLLCSGGVVYLERGEPFEHFGGFRVLKRARAGEVHFHLLDWGADDQGNLSGIV